MKSFFISMIIISTCLGAKAQQAMSNQPALMMDTTLSTHITRVLTDSLGLSATQSGQLRVINLFTDSCKKAIFRRWAHTDSLNILIRRAEYSRDSAVRQLLTDRQFVQYGQHKMIWVLNR